MKVVYALLALALLRGILLFKTYRSIPLIEFKRRARQHDKKAGALYRVASYGAELDLRTWLFCTAAGSVLIIWSSRTDWRLAVAVIVIISLLITFVKASAEGWAGRLAALFSPFDSWLLLVLHPVLGWIVSLLPFKNAHTGLYEKRDLVDLIKKQISQPGNRIHDADLRIAEGAMTFGDKTVGSVMTPRRQVKMVGASETLGPILTDELFKTGFSRFPVVKDPAKAAPEVVGTLYLNNLIGYDGNGKVKDLAKKEVYFVNEDCSLRQALQAFLKTHHHLLIVVNSFEEMAGVLTLEDVLEQIIGKQIVDEFDAYENLRAVAGMSAEKEQAAHQEVKPDQTEQTVVE